MPSYDHDRKIFSIHQNYHAILLKIIKSVLNNWNNVLPIDAEDIYNAFLLEIPKIIESFDKNRNITFATYILYKCKNFARNYCTHYRSSKYAILNFAIPMDSNTMSIYDSKSDGIDIPIDFSILNKMERTLYIEYFINKMSLDMIAEKYNITICNSKNIVNSARQKIMEQL